MTADQFSRAQGCLLGQLAGDSLGSLVEFKNPEEIRRAYPDGVRDLADGGTWGTIAGQPSDDSEMALSLARSLIECGTFDVKSVREGYCDWLASRPFDCGTTVSRGLTGQPNFDSEALVALREYAVLAAGNRRTGLERRRRLEDTYTAVIKHLSPVWIGWIGES